MSMDELFSIDPDQTFLRREAVAAGYNDADLRRACRDGIMVRVRQGAYAPAAVWAAADDVRRHQLRAHAVLRTHASGIALSHTSAAVEHGLRVHRLNLDKVHVVCLDRKVARTTPDIVYHDGSRHEDFVVPVEGRPCVAPVRAGLEAASLCDVASGLVLLDSLIDLRKGTLDELHRSFAGFTRVPGSRKLQITVRLTRKGSQSVGESLGRHVMFRQGLPAPRLQYEVRDASGNLIGICDYAWPGYGLLGEFDGMSKYGRLRKEGETPGQAVEREKVREDKLRETTQFLMIRITWRELFDERRLGYRIRTQLDRGRRLVAA
jgi:hypothetical protein